MLNDTRLIILTGKAQSGKDSSCLFAKSLIENSGYSAKIYAFADPLKQLCCDLFNTPRELCWGNNQEKDTLTHYRWADFPLPISEINRIMKYECGLKNSILSDNVTIREMLQVWGTNIFRLYEPDCWVNATIGSINKESPDFAIISDARFPNEIELLSNFTPTVIRLLRNPLNSNHKSETALDDYDFSRCGRVVTVDNADISIDEKNIKLEKVLHEVLQNENSYYI